MSYGKHASEGSFQLLNSLETLQTKALESLTDRDASVGPTRVLSAPLET